MRVLPLFLFIQFLSTIASAGIIQDTMSDNDITIYEYAESSQSRFHWYTIENNSLYDIASFAVTTKDPRTDVAMDTWGEYNANNELIKVHYAFVDFWQTSFYSKQAWDQRFSATLGSFSTLFGDDDSPGVNWYAMDFDRLPPLAELPSNSISQYLIERGKKYGHDFNSPFQFYGNAASEFVAFDADNKRIAQSSLTSVPEPSTVIIMMLGLGGIWQSRRSA